MDNETKKQLQSLHGLVATCVLTGHVQAEFAQAHENLRSYNDRNGWHNVEYRKFSAVLVEQGRDEVIKHMLKEDYDFCLQVDADAVFPANALVRILHTAYVKAPDSDVVGAYCQLSQRPYTPTIDSGSGTWEEWYPDSGIVPAIRTGGHFLLVKKSAIQKMGGPPWFRTRLADRPVDAMADVDNFARCKLDGRNPLAEHPEWHTLVAEARDSSGEGPSGVGEDSAFMDRLKAAGGNLYVDTSIKTGHVGKKVVTPNDFRDAMKEQEEMRRNLCGIRE